jgi:hypothetical protein
MIKPMRVECPDLSENPKDGGLIDAIRNDMFVDWLCDNWPLHPDAYGMKDKEREDNERNNFYK